MIRVRFLSDQVVDDHLVGTDLETRFFEGQVIDLREDSAKHWLRRDLAELVDETVPVGVPERDNPDPIVADDGASRENGQDQPSSASLPGQASTTETLNESDNPTPPEDAKSSQLTGAGKKRPGRTRSTAPTRRGGRGRKTAPASKD